MVEAAGGANKSGGPSGVGGAGGANGAKAAEGPKAGDKVSPDARTAIGKATEKVTPDKIAGAARSVAGDDAGDVVDKVGDTVKGAAMGAREYGRIDPTNGQGINGATYTDKVKGQMAQSPVDGRALDKYHGFPSMVDEAAKAAKSTPFIGGDGKIRSLVEVPGAVGDKPGKFEYITNADKTINHRHFAEKAIVPEGARIPGTNALRGLGRVAAPLGLAMDAYEVANSPTPVKTAVEKAAGWGGAAASAGLVGSAAAPLLAGGIPGAIGYGVAVVGAGALGYFGGEAAARSVMGWFGL